MKLHFILVLLILLLTLSNSLPHFTFDGVESFYENLGETNKLSLTIYGSLSEEINPEKMHVQNYIIEDLGEFKCSLLNNEDTENKKRTHKIVCSIFGSFEMNGYILEEPKVEGFDFNDENGETTWPKQEEKKMFLIKEIGERIELDNEPILLGNFNDYVNPLNRVRKDIVDRALSSLPPRYTVNEEIMADSMLNARYSFSLTDAESAYMVYKWLSQNIEYDCFTYEHDHDNIDYTEQGTYNKGKGVCAGYSKIFRTMCNRLGLEAYYVSGFTKRSIVKGQIPTKTNHAWNTVKIDGIFYLVESTWGSGSCKGDKYEYDFDDFYFCTNPEIFIRKHLPAEQKYQLLPQPITISEFVNRGDITNSFYQQGFETINPDLANIKSTEIFSIIFTHDSQKRKKFLTHLYFFESGSEVEQENACWYETKEISSNITCYTNKQGKYKLKIYGGPIELSSYSNLVEYEIYSTKYSLRPKSFPEAYKRFKNSDMQLFEPLYNPLIRGRSIKFEIKTTTFDNLYITNKDKSKDNTHFRELDKIGNGVFVGEDVYIFGKEVKISTLINESYYHIVEYKTIRDSNQALDATFPESFNAPKNTLYSPLIDTLQIGKNFQFKIKCESCTEIAVREGAKYTYLDKEGSIFSKIVKINGSADAIRIVNLVGDSYKTMYKYKSSNDLFLS